MCKNDFFTYHHVRLDKNTKYNIFLVIFLLFTYASTAGGYAAVTKGLR